MAEGKKSGVVRIDEGLSQRIKDLLCEEGNVAYCSSVSNFVNVAVLELLEEIESNGNKIRWGSRNGE